ncbi:MAG: Fic family protein [Phycisphaerales bacterium]
MKRAQFQPGAPGQFVAADFMQASVAGSTVHQVHAFVPDPLPPALDWVSITGRLFELLDRAKTALLRLEGLVDSLPAPYILLSPLRAREAQASSKIEDTFASLRDIAAAALTPPTEASVPGHQAVEVVRNAAAIKHGLESRLPVSRRLLCDMHRVLVVERAKRPGQLRDLQVCIGDEQRGAEHARFVPPPASQVEACLYAWERFHNPGSIGVPQRQRLPYFIELALSHYQFETIHPFSDGNGRLGRAVVNVAPVKDGVLKHPVCNLSEWVHSNRQEYYDRLLAVSTHGDWEGWIRFFLTAIAEQAAQDTLRAERLRSLYQRYFKLLDEGRNSIRAMRLINHLFDTPAVSVSRAASIMGLAYSAAQRHVQFLIDQRVLRQLGDSARDRVYIAEGIIKAIRGDGED